MLTKCARIPLFRYFSAFTDKIESKLKSAFFPIFIKVDASDRVGGEQLQSEEYLNIKLVSDKFKDMSLVERHQIVHKIIDEDLKKVHAWNLTLLTPEQWINDKKTEK